MNIGQALSGNKVVSQHADAGTYPSPDTLKLPVEPLEPTPDWEDVRQYERPVMNTVPVCVEGAVMVVELPAKSGVGRTHKLDTLANIPNPPEVIPADPRIKRAILMASAGGVLIGTMEQIKVGDGFTITGTQPMIWTGFGEPLYASASAASTLSVRYEFWAD